MSQGNVEIVHRLVDAWNRRDVDAMLALTDPECEYINSPTAVEPGTRRGSDELVAVAQSQWEILTDARQEVDRASDRGEVIISLGRVSRRMPGSDDRIEDRSLVAWTFRDGKLIRLEVLGFGATKVRGALEAAGLSE